MKSETPRPHHVAMLPCCHVVAVLNNNILFARHTALRRPDIQISCCVILLLSLYNLKRINLWSSLKFVFTSSYMWCVYICVVF